MKIYVAAKTHDVDRAQKVMTWVRECGHEVTFDWTVGVKKLGDANESELTHEVQQAIAINDRRGVAYAQLVIALAHPDVCGTLMEIGMALAFSTPVWLVGQFPRESVFFHMEQVTRVNDDNDLYRRVTAL